MTFRAFAALAATALLASGGADSAESDQLASLPAVGTVDARFLSYNVEMVEVTGGRFWRPFGSPGTERHEYRPPLDLSDRKLRQLAAALGPAYVRVSGTWANATWFADGDQAPEKAPTGFDTVLTRQQWRGVVNFARASNAKIVTSFAVSPGTRDSSGAWQTETAARWLTYTKSIGGAIAAAEFANEPNMVWLTQAPKDYTGADYRRDYARFAGWLKKASPDTLLIAPGVAELGEPSRSLSRRSPEAGRTFEGSELIAADSPRPDAFSYHYYGGPSLRCGNIGQSVASALSAEWLDGVDAAIARVITLRDKAAPGVPLWNTESAEAACGGNQWAAAFADTFRFVDTLGRSARQGVRVYIHNTLSASDYALLDEHTYAPRPNYWAAVLWKRTMGTTVLAPPASPSPDLRVYTHCLVGKPGGVGLVAINLGDRLQRVAIGKAAQRWLLQAPTLDSKAVTVNGKLPALRANGTLAGLSGETASGSFSVPGKSVAFIANPKAANPACR